MNKVGGKGNEKNTSDGQRVCFGSPHHPPPPRPALHTPVPGETAGTGIGGTACWVPRSFARPANRNRLEIRGPWQGQASAPPPQGPNPSLLLRHTRKHSGRSRAADSRPLPASARVPAARPLPSHPHPSPPAAEAPDGGSSRRARGPQTPPSSSRRSLPPSLPAAAAETRMDCFERTAGSCTGSDWDGSPAAEGHAGAALTGKQLCRPQMLL
ncbi:uncharacterized protein LOC125922380 [Panthera uncia]|uniref:uncharacterized protein LOC125922380 n=1 Tax=Panthera uncia TaxID=29064 RepID=UPI0020FFBD01|nr:uncharacterized protein LOC125922380 [Panthera uncia]